MKNAFMPIAQNFDILRSHQKAPTFNFRPTEAPDRSYLQTKNRFASRAAATRYPSTFGFSWRQGQERRAIRKALRFVPPGAHVLDLPCGSGRAMPLLLEQGYRVTGADASPAMLELAEQNLARWHQATPGLPDIDFKVRDIMRTGFENDRFDAVLCNRLFHHFREPYTRRIALRELRRICRGPLIVSFFNTFAVDAWTFHLRQYLRGTTPIDRIPISLAAFRADADAVGLRINATISKCWGISRQWYVILSRG